MERGVGARGGGGGRQLFVVYRIRTENGVENIMEEICKKKKN